MSSISGKRFVIAGGTGFLGTGLAEYLLNNGADVTVLGRDRPSHVVGKFLRWEPDVASATTSPSQLGSWAPELDGCDVLINLAGRTVDCIKSPENVDEILRSRLQSTRALGMACRAVKKPPPLWIQMSTAHIYGDPASTICSEDTSTGLGLAPDVGRRWEAEFDSARLSGQRGIVMRTSFVIGRDRGNGGGALSRLRLLARLGLGGRVGRGQQGFSWLHESDFFEFVRWCYENSCAEGIYNLTSPQPASQTDFMRSLRNAVGMPIGLPSSEWMVRLGAKWILRTDPELALYGRRVIPARLESENYTFQFADLDAALIQLVKTT